VKLPATEGVDASTAAIDRLAPPDLARLLLESQRTAVDAALAATDAIGGAIVIVADALRAGARVVLFGAGTSGRLAVLDASELPPTFGLEPGRVIARIAGGEPALRNAVEGAEDDEHAGTAAAADLRAEDVAIGISASGGAPFVRAALLTARAQGAYTIAIVNADASPLATDADLAIVAETGAEPIAGSTRMRAGTAQKLVLNTISTGAMVLLGKTYRNRMVDVVASNVKLRARAERLVHELAPGADAAALLQAANRNVKVAVVMAHRGVNADEARRLLARAGGRLSALLA